MDAKQAEATMSVSAASNEVIRAIDNLRLACRSFVEQYGRDVQSLHNIINCNRAQWSGGPMSNNNLTESIMREEAVAALGRGVHRNIPLKSL